jgi:hypothetical protein
MTRRPATFRQRDLTRAIRAAAAAGVPVARVSVDKSGLGQPAHTAPGQPETNEWDGV